MEPRDPLPPPHPPHTPSLERREVLSHDPPPRRQHRGDDPSPAPRRARAARRTRMLVLAAAAAILTTTAVILGADAPPPLPRQLAVAVAVAAGVLVTGALLTRLRRLWEEGLRAALQRVGDRLGRFSLSLWPWSSDPKNADDAPPLRAGERVALCAGAFLCALDVVLTTLLLRDVFPEPPYRFALLDELSPALGEWSFYVVVASFKAILELWLGVVDRLRARAGGDTRALRWFVLGLASAFDAALAVARGLLLAEQGLAGATVLVSNIVFVGFGVAVPWVVAHTGGLLVDAADPLLARFGLLRLLAALPRLALLAALWGAAIVLGAPVVLAVIAVGALMVVWSALDELLVTILGHDDPDGTAFTLAEASSPSAPPPAREGGVEMAIVRAGGGR